MSLENRTDIHKFVAFKQVGHMVNRFDDKIAFRKAVEQVWGLHSAQIQRLCERKCANAEEARDLFQTVALKFCENLQDLMTRRNVMPWLITVVHNTFLDIVAERNRSCLMSVHEEVSEYMAYSEERGAFYERQATPELRLFVTKTLDLLNPLERMLLEMKYFGGFSIKEIGDILGLSENSVRKRRFHAFLKIRQFYMENDPVSKMAQ